MAQRLLLALMVLWCVGAVGWFLLHDGGDEAQRALGDPAPLAEDSVPAGPSLAARPPSVGGGLTSPAGDGDGLPEWVHRVTLQSALTERARFLAWLEEDPSRIFAFLRAYAAPRGGVTRPYNSYYLALRGFFQPVSSELAFLLPTLRSQLAEDASESGLLTSVVAVLSAMEVAGGETHPELHALMQRESTPARARILAAETLLETLGPTPAVLSSLETLLKLPAATLLTFQLRGELLLLLGSIRKLEERGRALTPALLAMFPHAERLWGLDTEVLKALASASPADPRVRLMLVRSLEAQNSVIRRIAREALFPEGEREHSELLALLRHADGPTRVAGISALLEAGHAPEELAPLLMPALTDPSPAVRRRAVSLLGKVGRDVHEILPALRELLAAEQQDRWLTGVQALGALSTVAGDRDAVLQLLFVAVRLPNSRVRKVAVQSLLMFDEHTERIIPLLADLLDDTEADVRREAVDGLGELAAHDEGAEAHLRRALGDSDESVRALAQYWLSEDEDSDD